MSQIPDSTASRRALLGSALGLGGAALAISAPGEASAAGIPTDPASDFFLTIPGIPGESRDKQFPLAIDLFTWSFGATSSVAAAGTGSGADKSKPSPFVFVARTGQASPKLLLNCATGRRLASATLDARSHSDPQRLYLRVKLETVVVTSYQTAPGEQDGWPLDVVRLDYVKITTTYTSQNADGSPATPVTAGFDYLLNKAL
jgi:type VI secretion system secreted protein Hcp